MRQLWLNILLAVSACAAAATDFDPTEFFGAQWQAGEHCGVLALSLREGTLPHFIDLGASGNAPASTRVRSGAGGTVLSAQPRTTLELGIDLGALNATAGVRVLELDQGGTLAWRLRGIGQDNELLAELTRSAQGFTLRMRARGAGRFIQVPGAVDGPHELSLPAVLTLTMGEDFARLEIAGHNVRAQADFPQGAMLAVAVSDQRARIAELSIEARLAPAWKQNAAARLDARRSIERLRSFATAGLLSGISAHPHPRIEELLALYDDDQRQVRAQALTTADSEKALALRAIAELHPENPLALHEAGVAALLAGMTGAGHRLLLRAEALSPSTATRLALTEACRRVSDAEGAQRFLRLARERLPEELAIEADLIEARLLADRGSLQAASVLLESSLRRNPDHSRLEAFAVSARMLTGGEALDLTGVTGPLGLTVYSDLPDADLEPILRRLGPYLRAMRDWLPGMPDELSGRILVFSGPVEYLAASLLVAGEQLDNIAGMFVRSGIEAQPMILACRAFGEDELTRTLVHELWHLCLSAMPFGRDVPRWLDEGMAVYFSAGRVDGTRLVFDSLPTEFASTPSLLDAAMRPSRLRAVLDASVAEFYDASEVRLNYAAAWAIVWYHARESGRRAQLGAKLRGGTEFTLGEDPESTAQSLAAAIQRLR